MIIQIEQGLFIYFPITVFIITATLLATVAPPLAAAPPFAGALPPELRPGELCPQHAQAF